VEEYSSSSEGYASEEYTIDEIRKRRFNEDQQQWQWLACYDDEEIRWENKQCFVDDDGASTEKFKLFEKENPYDENDPRAPQELTTSRKTICT